MIFKLLFYLIALLLFLGCCYMIYSRIRWFVIDEQIDEKKEEVKINLKLEEALEVLEQIKKELRKY